VYSGWLTVDCTTKAAAPSNELVGQIHDRMPAILEPKSYERWLGLEHDPHDLLITYPSEPMTMWPISTRVNKPENDDPSILERVAEPIDWQAPLGLTTNLGTNTDADDPGSGTQSIK
jgi:putative SOS response-associated peptidase YedK